MYDFRYHRPIWGMYLWQHQIWWREEQRASEQHYGAFKAICSSVAWLTPHAFITLKTWHHPSNMTVGKWSTCRTISQTVLRRRFRVPLIAWGLATEVGRAYLTCGNLWLPVLLGTSAWLSAWANWRWVCGAAGEPPRCSRCRLRFCQPQRTSAATTWRRS